MRFNFAAAALLAMAVSVVGKEVLDFDSIFKPTRDQVVQAGSTVEIAWSITNEAKYKNVKVDIEVLGGPSFDLLQNPKTIATGVNNSDLKFEWKVDSSLGSEKQYGLRILLSTDKDSYQWSERFTIKKAEGGSSNSADTSSTTMSVSGTKSDSETPSSTVSVSSAKSTKANQPTSSVQTNANTVAPVTSTSTSTSTNTGSSTGSSTSSQSAATTTTPTAGARQTAAPVMAALGGVVAAMFVL